MLKTVFASIIVLFSLNVFAVTPFEVLQQSQLNNIQKAQRPDWKTGDSCNYNVDMGFIKGSMVMSVGQIGTDGVWMIQDMDLGFMGKQKMEMLMDPATGQIKKLLVNGKEEQVPETPELEIIEIVTENLTVPAGTFETQHMRLKDVKANQEMNMWATPEVPVSGLVKQVQPSQLGQVTMVLTGFHKQP